MPEKLERAAEKEARKYAAGHDRPLGAYLGTMAAYGAAVAGASALIYRSGRPLPERPSWSDLALIAGATHKISRLVTKDPVTSPLRVPFTRYEGTSGPAELSEEVRGTGARKTVGELVTCPFCVGQWVATGLALGMVLLPRPTRLAAGTFTALAGADFLQFLYARAEG